VSHGFDGNGDARQESRDSQFRLDLEQFSHHLGCAASPAGFDERNGECTQRHSKTPVLHQRFFRPAYCFPDNFPSVIAAIAMAPDMNQPRGLRGLSRCARSIIGRPAL
jgi:hypothetical protein